MGQEVGFIAEPTHGEEDEEERPVIQELGSQHDNGILAIRGGLRRGDCPLALVDRRDR